MASCGGKTYEIIMVRHGESEWNKKNLFCGWFDSELSDLGLEEAHTAGRGLCKEGACFDLAFSSVLKRANKTLDIILEELGLCGLPIVKSWRLNERHYGALTGLNKVETVEKYGEQQVQIWRRSFDTPPPPMDCSHPYFKCITNDPIYKDGPSKQDFPMFESLEMTIKRTLPFWEKDIVPAIKDGKRVLVAAHGNSLRGIVKHLDDMSKEKIMELNLPTGIPFKYILNEEIKPKPNGSLIYLGDPEVVKKAIDKVANQTKKK